MNGEIYIGNDIYLSEDENCLINGSIKLAISEKEKRLLRHFIRNPDIELTKQNLIDSIWEHRAATINDASLTHLVYKIRRDLAAMNIKDCIRTIPGKGYAYLPRKIINTESLPIPSTTVGDEKTVKFFGMAMSMVAVIAMAFLFYFLHRR